MNSLTQFDQKSNTLQCPNCGHAHEPGQGLPQPAGEAGATPSLGTITVTLDRPQNTVTRAVRKQDLLTAAKELRPGESRLQACLAIRVDASKTVGVEYAPNVDKARATNVARCNYHICPNCGGIIAQEKREILTSDVAVWDLEGFACGFIVLTIQHFAGESCKTVDDRLKAALVKLWDSRGGREWRAKWRLAGREASPDCTVGANGWHGHKNTMLFFERRKLTEAEAAECEAELARLWQAACKAVGGYADIEHGCKLYFDRIFDLVDYMTSKAGGCGGGQGQAGDPGQWGAAEELTKSHLKRSKGGRTPLDLLQDYMFGDDEAGRLWAEYATVYKGKKFLDCSQGFRARLDELKAKHTAEMEAIRAEARGEMPLWVPVCHLGPAAFAQLVEQNMLLWLIAEVKEAKGDAAAVREWLEEDGITQVWYPSLDPEKPDWMIAPEGTPPDVIQGIREFNRWAAEWNSQPWPVGAGGESEFYYQVGRPADDGQAAFDLAELRPVYV